MCRHPVIAVGEGSAGSAAIRAASPGDLHCRCEIASERNPARKEHVSLIVHLLRFLDGVAFRAKHDTSSILTFSTDINVLKSFRAGSMLRASYNNGWTLRRGLDHAVGTPQRRTAERLRLGSFRTKAQTSSFGTRGSEFRILSLRPTKSMTYSRLMDL